VSLAHRVGLEGHLELVVVVVVVVGPVGPCMASSWVM
jgi:hypothetical protein